MTLREIVLPLRGAGGEPVDFVRTITGHGVTSLPPMTVDETLRTLTVTLAVPDFPPRTVTLRSDDPSKAIISLHGSAPTDQEVQSIEQTVRHLLRLDQDLSPFYALTAHDPALRWVQKGAGRMTRCQTVFEDIVKTILTTNCAWSATVRMSEALVKHLGEAAPDAPPDSWVGRAFPTAAAMADADENFYRAVVKCGYRANYLKSLARSIADGTVEVESLGSISPSELSDDEVAKRLIALPGVGPYAAAHIMMMIGRYSRLVLDSWTRPTYARRIGRESIEDAEIVEHFARFGEYAGLAFWLSVTEDWVPNS